ncbi:glutathione synthetase-like [Salvelinus alpinus]
MEEVAIVYFRYGYIAQNYTEQSWEARLMMERFLAVKCPDISTHLAGTKMIQQELARPGVLERFFPGEPDVVDQIWATFAGLYTLDMGPESDKTVYGFGKTRPVCPEATEGRWGQPHLWS